MENDRDELRQLGLDPDVGPPGLDLANRIFVAYLLRQHERREALHNILDSHIKECERRENSGEQVKWDWHISVTERATKPEGADEDD